MSINAGTVAAYLTLDTNKYTSSLKTASFQMRSFLDDMQPVGDRLTGLGSGLTTFGTTLMKGVTLPLAGIGATIVTVSANFETAMSEVKAISGATGAEFEVLRDKAKEMGESTKYSASEAAGAFKYMSLAGWDAQQQIAAIPGVLNLAAAANMELARASDIVTDNMSAFALEAEKAAHVADVYAYAQNNANTDVLGLGEAMKYISLSAHNMNVDIETTSAMIGKLADVGLKGSMAGTALNAMFRDMKKQADAGNLSIGNTVVALTGLDGSYRNIVDIIADIEKATRGMTDAQRDDALMAVVRDEGLRALNGLLAAGSDSIREFTGEMYALDGYAQDVAATMQDNLQGQLTVLKSKLEGIGITLGETLLPAITPMVDKINTAVDAFAALNPETQTFIVNGGLMLAAAGPLIIAGGKLITTTVQLATGIKTISTALYALTGPTGLVIGAVTLIGSGAVMAWNAYKKAQEDARQSMLNAGETLDNLAKKMTDTSTNTKTINELLNAWVDLDDQLHNTTLTQSEQHDIEQKLKTVGDELIQVSDGLITRYDVENGLLGERVSRYKEIIEQQEKLADAEFFKALDDFDPEKQQQELERLIYARNELEKSIYQEGEARLLVMDIQRRYFEILEATDGSTDEQNQALQALQTELSSMSQIGLTLSDVMLDFDSTIESVNNKINEMEGKLKTTNEEIEKSENNLTIYNRMLGKTAEEIKDQIDTTKDSTTTQSKTNAAITESTEALQTQAAALSKSTKEINDLLDSADDLQSSYETLAKGEKLSVETMLDLITTYPALAKHIANTSDFTFNHGEVLKEVARASRETAIQNAKDEIAKTETTITNTTQRITAIQAEITALQSVYSLQADASGLDARIEEQKKNKKALEDQLKAAEDALATTESMLAVLENANAFAVKGAKTKKEENKALKEALKTLEDRIELEDLATAEIIKGYAEIKATYARTQDEIIDIDKKIKRQREQMFKEELAGIEKITAASKNIFTGEIDYASTIMALEKLLDLYAEVPAAVEQINEKLAETRRELSDQNARIAQAETEAVIDGINREISQRKELDGLIQQNGETYHYTAEAQIKDTMRVMEANERLIEYLRSLGDEMTEAEAAMLTERLKLQQGYHDQVRTLYVESAKAYQQAQDEIKALDEQYAEDRAKLQRELSAKTQDTQRKLHADLLKLKDDYEKKVTDSQKKLADGEKKLTEAYEKELSNRAKSISNFVGLFDEVTAKDVSGEQLLERLRGQLDTVKDWQKNLNELAKRGLDENLLAELIDMKPTAASEIAALNSMTDEMLDEYVAIYREKAVLAEEEANRQSEAQRRELQENIEALRAEAAVEMEKLADELQQQTESVREAAAETLAGYVSDWRTKLAELNKTVKDQMDTLRETADTAMEGMGVLNAEDAAAAVEAILAQDTQMIDERLVLYGLDAENWAANETGKTNREAEENGLRVEGQTAFNKDKKVLYGKDAAEHKKVEEQKTADVQNNLNTQKSMVRQAQQENMYTLRSFIPEMQTIGQMYGNALLQGIQGTRTEMQSYLDSVAAAARAASSGKNANVSTFGGYNYNAYGLITGSMPELMTANLPELTSFTAGMPADEYHEMMSMLNDAVVGSRISADMAERGLAQTRGGSESIDYEKLGKSVASALGDKIKPNVHYSPTYHSPKPTSVNEQRRQDQLLLWRLGQKF